jgi:hypothetical protein
MHNDFLYYIFTNMYGLSTMSPNVFFFICIFFCYFSNFTTHCVLYIFEVSINCGFLKPITFRLSGLREAFDILVITAVSIVV